MAVKNCKFCDREGVLIYPVRYAVACPRGAAGVPGLSGNFRIEGAPQQIVPAKYTLRTIRSGYLYTYDESRRRLKAYMVTDMGYLWNFQPAYVPPSPDLLIFKCTDKDEIALARCIDIKHSPTDPATNLWIGWSNSLWTQALVKKIGDAAWRKKHMQCIYIPAMVAGKALHTAEFAANYKKIAHFACDEAAMKTAFAFSNVPIKNEWRQHSLGPVMAETMAEQAPHFKGFVVALNDPVGITNDLSELVLPTIDAGFDEHEYRGRIVCDLLKNAEVAIKAQARSDVILADEVAKNSKSSPDGDPYGGIKTTLKVIKAGGFKKYLEKQKRDQDKYGADQAGRQDAAAEDAWDDAIHIGGKPILDTARLNKFDTEYEAAVSAFVPIFERLASAHVNWLSSLQLANWMDGVHDSADIRSGYAYSESLAQCIGNAAATQPCQNKVEVWLSGKLWGIENLYARALLFNQEDLISAFGNGVSFTDIQLETMIQIHEDALDRLNEGEAKKLIDRLVLTTGNILIRALKGTIKGPMRALVIARLSIMAGSPIKITEHMNAKAIVKWMMAEAKAFGVVFSDGKRKARRDAYSIALEIMRRNSERPGAWGFRLDVQNVSRNGKFTMDSVSEIGIPGVKTAIRWLGSDVPREFHVGVVITILQIVTFSNALQNLSFENKPDGIENMCKAFISGCGLVATLMGVISDVVKKSVSHPLSAFIMRHWSLTDERLINIGEKGARLSVAAGLAAAGVDFYDAYRLQRKGELIVAGLHVASGIIGVAASLAVYAEYAMFWQILLLYVAVNIAIAVFSSSDLQHWISRCFFGTNVKERYQNVDEEIEDFRNAIGV